MSSLFLRQTLVCFQVLDLAQVITVHKLNPGKILLRKVLQYSVPVIRKTDTLLSEILYSGYHFVLSLYFYFAILKHSNNVKNALSAALYCRYLKLAPISGRD